MPEDVFKNIDYANKTVAEPLPDRINDIDTHNILYDNIIEGVDNNVVDLNSINSFTQISQTRDELYSMIDIMCEDPIISIALDIYTSDCCEPNDKGQIVWAESADANTLGMVQHLLDQINADKNAYKWVHSLIKYGDLYLRLFRESEFNDELFYTSEDAEDAEEDNNRKLNESKESSESLNEDVILKAYKKDDHYAEYLEMHKNPAEVFELQKFGKTIGYIRSHIMTRNINDDVVTNNYVNTYNRYLFNRSDVDVYQATEFVHACLEDNSTRAVEEVSITSGAGTETNGALTYNVKRGQSLLYNTFRTWRELSLLENSVLLNRITKSSIVRTVSVQVGDMEKNQVRQLLQRIKTMVEQKSAIKVGNSYDDYTNPGPIENIIYIPVHGETGTITMGEIGGNVESDNLTDVDYFKNKLFASLGIPGAYLGEGDSDGTLFNNGSSLSLKSSKYAKTVKRIQNAFCQALTDAINLMLLDKHLNNYINNFTIRMQAPTTQEEKDRRENLSSTINNIRDIMDLLSDIEDQVTKLEVLKSLLSGAVNDPEVLTAIQNEIDRLEADKEAEEAGDMGDEFGDEDLGGDFGGEELGGEDMGGSVPMEFGGGGEEELPSPEELGPPEEGFESGTGDLLNEENNLPSFYDLGINYTDVH